LQVLQALPPGALHVILLEATARPGPAALQRALLHALQALPPGALHVILLEATARLGPGALQQPAEQEAQQPALELTEVLQQAPEQAAPGPTVDLLRLSFGEP